MELLEIVLLILLVVVCIALGALVLIQQGRGSDIGAAFGSGAANTIFGSGGATPFLVKFTAMLAIGFFAVTFTLAYTAKEKSKEQSEGYNFGDLPQSNEETLDDFSIPTEEDLLPSDESDTTSTPEDDETPGEPRDEGDILEQLLNEEEEEEGDTLPPPETESEDGDTLPDL